MKKMETDNNITGVTEKRRALDLHLKRADCGYTMLKRFKPHGEYHRQNQACLCIDLAQTRPIPKLVTNMAFYSRKVNAYNCGIHDLNTGKGHMFMWPENVAKRGSNEVASCLYKYIETYVNPKIKELVIFSDNCAGQNKNLNITLACLRLIQKKRFSKITHIFMVAGHSYMDCDRDFGHISRKLKGQELFGFNEYVKHVKEAKMTKKFEVYEMKKSDFKNFNSLQGHVTNRRPFEASFCEGRIFVYTDKYQDGYYMKNNYGMWMGLLNAEKVDLRKGDLRKNPPPGPPQLASVPLEQLYHSDIKLSDNKCVDIQKLLRVIPAENQGFLKKVLAGQQGKSLVNIEPGDYQDYHGNDIE